MIFFYDCFGVGCSTYFFISYFESTLNFVVVGKNYYHLTNGAGTTEHPHGKKWKSTHKPYTLHETQNSSQMEMWNAKL